MVLASGRKGQPQRLYWGCTPPGPTIFGPDYRVGQGDSQGPGTVAKCLFGRAVERNQLGIVTGSPCGMTIDRLGAVTTKIDRMKSHAFLLEKIVPNLEAMVYVIDDNRLSPFSARVAPVRHVAFRQRTRKPTVFGGDKPCEQQRISGRSTGLATKFAHALFDLKGIST